MKTPQKTKMFAFKQREGGIFREMEIDAIEIDDIDTADAPDFCDAFISYAEVKDMGIWREATEDELEQMQEDTDLVYSEVEKALY